MRSRCLTAALLALALPPSASAAPAASRTVVFQGGTVLDGSGGQPLEGGSVVVRDGKIVSVGLAINVKVPKGAEVIDFKGQTLLPGLISDHSHVGQTSGTTMGSQNYTRENVEKQLRQFAAYGVTTVTALGMNRPLFNELRKEAHADSFTGADLFGAGQGIGVPEGGPPQAMTNSAPDQLFRPTTVEEARAAVRTLAKNRVDLVKVWVDTFLGKLPKMKPDIYKAVIDESHKQGLRVAAHIHDLEDAKAVVDAGVDIIAHGVRDQPVDAAFGTDSGTTPLRIPGYAEHRELNITGVWRQGRKVAGKLTGAPAP